MLFKNLLGLNNRYALNKFDQAENALEKSLKNEIRKCEISDSMFEKEISKFYQELENARDKEVILISTSIQDLVKSLKSKADLLKNNNIGSIKDFDEFKAEMVDIQDKIVQLETASKLELDKLKIVENDLNDELDLYFNQKVIEWSENVHLSTEFVLPKIKNKPSEQCKEVKQFFDFVHQSGGHMNGWRKEDHQLYLKMRLKYGNIDDLTSNLRNIFPDLSAKEIQLHDEWFRKYSGLLSKKKEAIKKWKMSKNNNKNMTKGSSNKGDNEKIQSNEGYNLKLKEKLSHWKMEKEEKLLTEEALEKEKLLGKIDKERRRRHQQLEIKKIVNEWKESKIAFEQSQKHQQNLYENIEKKRKAANANKLIKQFRSMDELYILKMRQMHKKVLEQPRQRVQSGPSGFRDPNRLLQPTKQWTERTKAVKEPLRGSLPIFAAPKLAIPEWRRNIV